MRPLTASAIGFGLSLALTGGIVAGVILFERQAAPPAARPPAVEEGRTTAASATQAEAGPTAPASSEAHAGPDSDETTRDTLTRWLTQGAAAGEMKPRIMDLAQAYFRRHVDVSGTPPAPLRVVFLPAADYQSKSMSHCEDATDVQPRTEAWLLDVPADTLYVNSGFQPATAQSPTDLFFRYLIGLYSVAPQLKSYPTGVKSADGTTAYYEKGLILLGRRSVLDNFINSGCYLEYRLPLEQAFTANRALKLLAGLGLSPSPAYDYPQKRNLQAFNARIAPLLGSTVDDLLDPFLRTDSGEFYRRVGRAVGSGGDAQASQAAADKLFRQVFPASQA